MPTSLSSIRGVAGVAKWVSGTTYGLDAIVWSPVNRLTYVRIVAGAGTTDPSADGTNWSLFGPTKRKSIQRGVISADGTANTATVTVTSVDTSKATLRNLGEYKGSPTGAAQSAHIRLTNATTITLTRTGGATTGWSTEVSWELEETW